MLLRMLVPMISLVLFAASGGNSSPCVPRTTKTALIVGQDYWSIYNYSKSFHQHLFGLMSYTALNSSTGSLQGLWIATDYGSGIEWAYGSLKNFPGASLQLGLYLVDQCDAVLSGNLDGEINKLIDFAKFMENDLYIRIGYEFDLPGNRYEPETYILTFRYIVDKFRSANASNVAFVWHSCANTPYNDLSPHKWYPGDDYVDWCGISLFEQPYSCPTDNHDADSCIMLYPETFAQLCKNLNRHIMIAESTPFGGILDNMSHTRGHTNRANYSGDSWDVWFSPVLRFIGDATLYAVLSLLIH